MSDFEALMRSLSGNDDPDRIVRADLSHIDVIADMRVRQQVEHWTHTLGEDFSVYAQQYRGTTKRGIEALSWKLQGMSISEIADALQIPPSHVGAWISKAKSALRRNPEFKQTIL